MIRPILFNSDMVRAILEGRKTVTRRVIKPYNARKAREQEYCQGNGMWVDLSVDNGDHEGHVKDYSISPCWISWSNYIKKYAPYRPGDILYVRETWHKYEKRVGRGEKSHMAEFYGYKASVANSEDASEKWRPSIHMPKEAARIWLKVTDVKVERLQNITEEQAKTEGAIDNRNFIHSPDNEYDNIHSARKHFAQIWDSTIKKSNLACYGWKANPWVWVIEFERCEKPRF